VLDADRGKRPAHRYLSTPRRLGTVAFEWPTSGAAFSELLEQERGTASLTCIPSGARDGSRRFSNHERLSRYDLFASADATDAARSSRKDMDGLHRKRLVGCSIESRDFQLRTMKPRFLWLEHGGFRPL